MLILILSLSYWKSRFIFKTKIRVEKPQALILQKPLPQMQVPQTKIFHQNSQNVPSSIPRSIAKIFQNLQNQINQQPKIVSVREKLLYNNINHFYSVLLFKMGTSI